MTLPMTIDDIPTDLLFRCALLEAMRQLNTGTIYVDKTRIMEDLKLSLYAVEAGDRMQRCIKVKSPDIKLAVVVVPEPIKVAPADTPLLSDKFDPHVSANLLRDFGPDAGKSALERAFPPPYWRTFFLLFVALTLLLAMLNIFYEPVGAIPFIPPFWKLFDPSWWN